MSDINLKKIKRIQVPNVLIKQHIKKKTICKQIKLSHKAFYLYITLKTVCINNIVHIKNINLLNLLNWKDTRLLKTYLKELNMSNIITYDFGLEKLSKNQILTINIIYNVAKFDKAFTQVDVDTINKIKYLTNNITHTYTVNKVTYTKYVNLIPQAIRLFYYREMDYNLRLSKSYKTTIKQIGIRDEDIAILNNIFNEHDIVKCISGKYKLDKTRECNQYIPYCSRYKKQ